MFPFMTKYNCLIGFQEIDELCDEWVPEPLIPSITEEMKYEAPVLERCGPIVFDFRRAFFLTSCFFNITPFLVIDFI